MWPRREPEAATEPTSRAFALQFPDLAEIARDLTTLEINTVIKPGMSAQKMPSSADALVDIAQDYHGFLCRRWAELTRLGLLIDTQQERGVHRYLTGAPPQQVDDAVLELTEEAAALVRRIRRKAIDKLLDEPVDPAIDLTALNLKGVAALDEDDLYVLFRIQRNVGQLKPVLGGAMIKRGGKLDLTPSEAVLLRKAWDVGTEVVVLQTVIQLDGDVLTRMRRQPEGDREAALMKVHNEAVTLSISQWRSLFDAFGRFAQTAASFLKPGT